ncbi:hypothetical protein K7X08_004192 [Anisodus acutangulus]|uniref:Zinc finger CCCH domain-containing protein 62-like n=1 Tax=Anisodus acutangulus TaxID=402998 RepID=A0A9Q1MI80_9SOLA|nr:hypothetical protein K7X08_004192 [Anisodus acutangulus]
MNPEQQQYDVSDSESDYDSDDSQEDPTFDILEETRSSLSKLSIKKHASKDMSARRNVSKALEECVEGEQDVDKIVPELDEKDQKSYETIQKIIKAGQIEKLKVEQCKVYLRKHGLRLTGSKDILIQRIKEHTDIVDGRGVEKYPPSSFVLNCKGDACTGDVVMFEQNVYEMFNIASKSATGPPCGTRIVAGRIVKESYGAKKQQHTFTVEVLWSKGEKPLPPLHPLLIKGRNLYRLETLRQKWDNEAERQKILSEKHARGFVARSNRETRVRTNVNLNNASSYRERSFGESIISNPSKNPLRMHNSNTHMPMWRGSSYGGNMNSNNSPLRMHDSNAHSIPPWRGYNDGGYGNWDTSRIPLRGHGPTYTTYGHSQNMNYRSPQRTENWQARNGWCDAGAAKRPFQGQREEQKRPCRFYAQGRCYYGNSCRYLHDSVDI